RRGAAEPGRRLGAGVPASDEPGGADGQLRRLSRVPGRPNFRLTRAFPCAVCPGGAPHAAGAERGPTPGNGRTAPVVAHNLIGVGYGHRDKVRIARERQGRIGGYGDVATTVAYPQRGIQSIAEEVGTAGGGDRKSVV